MKPGWYVIERTSASNFHPLHGVEPFETAEEAYAERARLQQIENVRTDTNKRRALAVASYPRET